MIVWVTGGTIMYLLVKRKQAKRAKPCKWQCGTMLVGPRSCPRQKSPARLRGEGVSTMAHEFELKQQERPMVAVSWPREALLLSWHKN